MATYQITLISEEHDINSTIECAEYCGALLRNMPEQTRPVFSGVEIDNDFYVHLLFSLSFMEVSGPPSQRYSLKSFGMIRPGEEINQAVRP